ncbi:11407_t:CDS:2, partial [Entrophospora sp. SA101]
SELELLAVKWATDQFHVYLLGKPFTIITDHQPLKYQFSTLALNNRMQKWLVHLQQYSFKIEYNPGRAQGHVDALSRLQTNKSINYIQQTTLKKIHEFTLKNDKLFWIKNDMEKRVIRRNELEEVLFNLHGRNKKKSNELHPIPVGRAFERIGIDIVGPLSITSKGNRYIIVATDYLTKWPEARAIQNIQAETVAQFIYEDIICRHGTPSELLSDRGTSFVNSTIKALCETMEINHVLTTSYHPQTNGLTERFNKTLCETIAKFVIQHKGEWDQYVSSALLAYRTKTQKSTKFTPFFLVYGRQAQTPLTQKFGMEDNDLEHDLEDHVDLITERLHHVQGIAKENINKAQEDQKA